MVHVELLPLVLAAAGGLLLGLLFFGGLRWTIHAFIHSKHPETMAYLSSILRTLMAALGIALLGGHSYLRVGAVLVGFLIAKPLVDHLFGRTFSSVRF